MADPTDATRRNESLSAIGTIVVKLAEAIETDHLISEEQWENWDENTGAFEELGPVWEEDAK